MTISVTNAFSLSNNPNFIQASPSTKTIGVKAVEEMPNSNELPNEYEEFNHLRQRRMIIFRPLFVYRQEQISKRRIEANAQRRRDQHVHKHIHTKCNCNHENYNNDLCQTEYGSGKNCHCHCD